MNAGNTQWPLFFSFELNSSLSCDVKGMRRFSDASPSCNPAGPIEISACGARWDSTIQNLNGILIVSSKLADEMKQAKLCLGTQYPVSLDKVGDGAIVKKEPQEYVYYLCRRALELDKAFFNYPEGVSKSTRTPYRKVPLPEKWLGDDLFGIAGEQWTSLFCSRRFVEIAFIRGWTHFYFMAMDLPDGVGRPGCRINPGKLKGLPQWYPDGFTPHPANIGPIPTPGSLLLPRIEEILMPQDPPVKLSVEPKRKLERPVDQDAGESTGLELFGEPVRWFAYDAGLDPADAEMIKSLIAPHLPDAVKVAENYLSNENKLSEEDEPPDVWGVELTVSDQTPEDGSELIWEMQISVSNAGVCPSHFLVFRGSELIDATAAD
jgi:hypothetical protein